MRKEARISAPYAFTKQFNVTSSAPYLFATRDSGAPAVRGEVSADGLGDLSPGGRRFVTHCVISAGPSVFGRAFERLRARWSPFEAVSAPKPRAAG